MRKITRLSPLYSLQKRLLFLPYFRFYFHIKHSAFLFRRRHCNFLIHDIPDKGRFRFRHSCHALYDHCRRIGRKPSDHSHRCRHILRPHILCRFHSRNCILHILRFRAHHICRIFPNRDIQNSLHSDPVAHDIHGHRPDSHCYCLRWAQEDCLPNPDYFLVPKNSPGGYLPARTEPRSLSVREFRVLPKTPRFYRQLAPD